MHKGIATTAPRASLSHGLLCAVSLVILSLGRLGTNTKEEGTRLTYSNLVYDLMFRFLRALHSNHLFLL